MPFNAPFSIDQQLFFPVERFMYGVLTQFE